MFNYLRVYSTSTKSKFSFFSLLERGNENLLISESTLTSLVNDFWSKVYINHKEDILMVQIQIKTSTNYLNLSKLLCLGYSDKEEVIDSLLYKINAYQQHYINIEVENMLIRYMVLDKDHPKTNLKRSQLTEQFKNFESITKVNLPKTLDLKNWGLLVNEIGDVQILKVDDKQTVYVHSKDQVRKVDEKQTLYGLSKYLVLGVE